MGYVYSNIFWCLLIAAAFGAVLGWLAKHWLAGDKLLEAENEWQSRLGEAEGERDRAALTAREAEGQLSTWKSKLSGMEANFGKLKADLDGMSARVPTLEAEITDWKKASANWESDRVRILADLKACAEARSTLMTQVAGLQAELVKAQ